MTHRSGGAYRILELPRVYETFQRLLGARAARARFVSEYLRPHSGARLLDIGCGTGSLLEDLPPDMDYVGFDKNPAYIEAARRRYAGSGTFYCAAVGADDSVASFSALPFDFVVAKSLLHHLNDVDAEHVIATARSVLRPGGVFVSSDAVFYDGQPWVSKMLATLDRGGSVRAPAGYRHLLARHFQDVEAWLVTDMLPIPYAHFIMRARSSP